MLQISCCPLGSSLKYNHHWVEKKPFYPAATRQRAKEVQNLPPAGVRYTEVNCGRHEQRTLLIEDAEELKWEEKKEVWANTPKLVLNARCFAGKQRLSAVGAAVIPISPPGSQVPALLAQSKLCASRSHQQNTFPEMVNCFFFFWYAASGVSSSQSLASNDLWEEPCFQLLKTTHSAAAAPSSYMPGCRQLFSPAWWTAYFQL